MKQKMGLKCINKVNNGKMKNRYNKLMVFLNYNKIKNNHYNKFRLEYNNQLKDFT